eukprot:2767985-Pyramimonas_sp.AAC.1
MQICRRRQRKRRQSGRVARTLQSARCSWRASRRMSKNLDWVHTFREECEHSEKHDEWAKKRYVTVPHALKEQNLALSDFKDHKLALEFVQE